MRCRPCVTRQKLAGVAMADFHIKLLAVWALGVVTMLEAPSEEAAAQEMEAADGEGDDQAEGEDGEED